MRSAFALLILNLFWASAHASERIGTFSIEDLRIRATFLNVERDGSEFDIKDSALSIKWSKDNEVSAFITLGSKLSRNLPVYYVANNDEALGVVEGYAQYEQYYGIFRVGLIPLNFGYEGGLAEQDRIFQRSLFFSRRVIGRSDMGMSFYTDNAGYYTQITVHNGEIDTLSDGGLWTTGRWGFTNDRSLRIQLSLQSGYVSSAQSLGGVNTLGGVTNGETARWRNGLFFVNWYPPHWNMVIEAGGGEFVQGTAKGRYNTTLFELLHQFSKNFSSGFRYNAMDPSSNTDGDSTTEFSVVMALKSTDSTSNLFLIGTKVFEEAQSIANDQIRLVWLLTPFAH